MAGLLLKDYYLLFQRKQSLVLFVALCLIIGFSIGGTFIAGYMSFLSAILVCSTISYDEADNGLLFLMTLPADRRDYALSKYIFGAVVCSLAWIMGAAMMFIVDMIKGNHVDFAEGMAGAAAMIPLFILLLDIMIPLQLKFGTEKSRMVMILAGGGIAALIVLAVKGLKPYTDIEGIIRAVDSLSVLWIVIICLLICAVSTVISITASTRIVRNKTF